MDGCMLEVFLAHLAQGLKTHQGWKKDVTYSAIKKELKENLSLDLSMTNTENMIKTMRKDVTTFRTLSRVSNSGFGWDSETQKVTADTHVWDEALKVHPEYNNFSKKILPRFSEWIEVLVIIPPTVAVRRPSSQQASHQVKMPMLAKRCTFPHSILMPLSRVTWRLWIWTQKSSDLGFCWSEYRQGRKEDATRVWATFESGQLKFLTLLGVPEGQRLQ